MMAESMLKQPGELNIVDGNVSEHFKRWKRQIEIYMLASGATAKSKEAQVAIILHCAGQRVIEVFDHFVWANPDDKKDPDIVLKSIEEYCNPRKNEVVESHRFWTLKYQQNFEQFMTDIRIQADSCNFGDRDRMLRDKIVFSMSGKMQELLLREDKLDLEKAIKICRAYEQSNKHAQEIRQSSEGTVHKIQTNSNNSAKHKADPKRKPKNYAGKPKSMINKCKFCGQSHERKKEKCPAYGKECNACKGKNHFRSVCKKVHAVKEETDSEEEFWLSYVEAEKQSKVTATMSVNDCEIKFQVDTGSEINTINQKYVRKSQVNSKITNLRMWNNTCVKSLGEAQLKVTNPANGEENMVRFVVVPNGFQSLLGFSSAQTLKLVTINKENIIGQITVGNGDLGDLGEVHLKIQEGSQPVTLPCRNVPLAIKDDIKAELDKLVDRGILESVTEATPWVNQMAVVRKSNGNLRLCIDPQPLNKVLIRERYKMPTFDDIVPGLHGAKIFTKLDVKEAYWHIKLDKESSLLTTMITPFGRFRWTRLPFGLNVSSEIFQRKLTEALTGLDGVFTIADDIIVVGCDTERNSAQEDHDIKVEKLNKRCIERNIVLNETKKDCGNEITFHGHRITEKGIMPDNEKIKAVLEMASPQDVSDVKRFCGFVQYLAKFLPNLAETLEPIRKLTHKGIDWNWDQMCEQAFMKIKTLLTKAPILAYYNPEKELYLQVDSSQSGLGAVLIQDDKPLEYASRALRPAEKNWAQIEKEALSVLYGLERFDQYTYGRKVVVQNDHKPLEAILKKPLSQAPKRLQDILMKLYRYNIEFQFIKGTELILADTLSRAFTDNDTEEFTRTRVLGIGVTEEFPDARIEEIKTATAEDSVLQTLIDYIVHGWPDKNKIEESVKPYFALRDTLSHFDGIVVRGEAILIPLSLRSNIKQRLHNAHMGFESMLRRARGTVFWLGMAKDIKQLAQNCKYCLEMKPNNQKEPLIQHSDGNYPWQKIGLDMFEIEGHHYLLAIDYYSNFTEIELMQSTTSQQVIQKLKKIFSRFGVPKIIISDGGPQFSSGEFLKFVTERGINHHLTAPHHPQSNGKAESGVKIMKQIIIKCKNSKIDPYIALLEQRNTPRKDTGCTPAEMMFGRKLRTMMPELHVTQPGKPNKKREARKESIKKYYNRKTKTLPKMKTGQNVYFKHKPNKEWTPGRIEEGNNRSYKVISSEGSKYVRNRYHIRPTQIPVTIRDTSPEREITVKKPMFNPTEMSQPIENKHQSEVREPTEQVPTYEYSRPQRERKPPKYLSDYVRK